MSSYVLSRTEQTVFERYAATVTTMWRKSVAACFILYNFILRRSVYSFDVLLKKLLEETNLSCL